MKLILGAVLLLASVIFASAEKARFDNYRVYTVAVENENQLKALREISETSDSYSFWEAPTYVGANADLIVPPHMFAHFGEIVEKFELKATLLNNNLQESIDNESPPRKEPKADGDMDWTSYHSTAAINSWLERLKAEFPNYVTVENIGNSYEGRPIMLAKVSKKAGNRAIFIEANIHAREWISGATSTYVLDQLLRSTDPEIQDLANNIDWYIIPISNPDGYEYTRSTNRNWRKTRNPSSSTCFGVDPNRNFGYSWMVPDENGNLGASSSPCSDTYSGTGPISIHETIAIEYYLSRTHQNFDIYLSFHSYAHMLLFPYGHRRARVGNFLDHVDVGQAAAARLAAVNGIQYTVGSTHEVLYAASGVSVDHATGHYQIPLGYTYEMRGNGVYGNYGFVLPPTLILANAQEVMASLIGMVQGARAIGYLQN